MGRHCFPCLAEFISCLVNLSCVFFCYHTLQECKNLTYKASSPCTLHVGWWSSLVGHPFPKQLLRALINNLLFTNSKKKLQTFSKLNCDPSWAYMNKSWNVCNSSGRDKPIWMNVKYRKLRWLVKEVPQEVGWVWVQTRICMIQRILFSTFLLGFQQMYLRDFLVPCSIF